MQVAISLEKRISFRLKHLKTDILSVPDKPVTPEPWFSFAGVNDLVLVTEREIDSYLKYLNKLMKIKNAPI